MWLDITVNNIKSYITTKNKYKHNGENFVVNEDGKKFIYKDINSIFDISQLIVKILNEKIRIKKERIYFENNYMNEDEFRFWLMNTFINDIETELYHKKLTMTDKEKKKPEDDKLYDEYILTNKVIAFHLPELINKIKDGSQWNYIIRDIKIILNHQNHLYHQNQNQN
jgi:hypothetical protein